jgi:hypothetical protein
MNFVSHGYNAPASWPQPHFLPTMRCCRGCPKRSIGQPLRNNLNVSSSKLTTPSPPTLHQVLHSRLSGIIALGASVAQRQSRRFVSVRSRVQIPPLALHISLDIPSKTAQETIIPEKWTINLSKVKILKRKHFVFSALCV